MIWPRAANQALQLTAGTTGARAVSGFLRRPTDGALVATLAAGTPVVQHGFVRDAAVGGLGIGPLLYNVGGAVAKLHNGFAFAADGSLCTVAVDPAPAYLHHGLKYDAVGRVYAVVLA